ncbi:hypothetical protein MUP59_00325 [Candidatus Bathyarchaeota archaeon]|nr:hypothetical protein [Candidatus Bathyarchaeota archaeon]
MAVLRFIDENPKSTSRDVSVRLNITVEDGQMELWRLFQQGLLNRRPRQVVPVFRKPYYEYEVSGRGLQRLSHWKERISPADSVSEERRVS